MEVALRVVERTDESPLIAINVRDITELNCLRNEKLLESRFRGLLEVAPDAMIIINPQGRIVLANPEAERLFGYSREELLGSFIEMLVPPGFGKGM